MPLDQDQLLLYRLQLTVECPEGRSVHGLGVPAGEHDLVGGLGRVLRALENVALFQVLDHFLVGEAVIGLECVAERRKEYSILCYRE